MPNRFKKAAEAGDASGGEETVARPKSSLKGDLRHLTASMKNVFRRTSSAQSHDSNRSDASDCGSLSSAGDLASLASEADPPAAMTGAAALLSAFMSDGGGDEDAIKAKLRELEAAQAEARRVGGLDDALGASSTTATTAATAITASTTASSSGAGSSSTSTSASSSSSSSTGAAAAAAAAGGGGDAAATVSAADAASAPGAVATPADGRPPLPKRKGSGLAPLDEVEKAGDASVAPPGPPERSSSFSSGLLAAGGASLATTLASLIGASPRHRSASAPNTGTAPAASALVSGWGSKAGGGGSGAGTPAGKERSGSGSGSALAVEVGDGGHVDLGGAEEAVEGYDGTETLSRNHPIFEMLRQRSQRVSSSDVSESQSLPTTDFLGKAEQAAAAGAAAAAEVAKAPAVPPDQPPPQVPVAHLPGADAPPTPSASVAAASLGAPPQPSPVAAGVAATSTAQGQGQNGTGAAVVHEARYTPFAPRGKADYHYAYVDKLVLKFTTYSQNNEESAFVIDKGGGTIGRDPSNTVSVPSDMTLQKEGHAVIGYKNGSFFLKNQGATHCAAIRIGTDPGLRDWPLELGATFSAGNSIFLVKELLNGDLILEITDGPLKGERRKVQRKGATIGRSPDNSLSVSDPELSRRHSRIEFDEGDGKYYVSDVGSTNGTYMQLVGPYGKVFHLALSDQIMVGRTGFSVNRFDYGISEERGRRKTMEDHTLVIQDLGIRALKRFGLAPQTFAAVFDGHGGEEASAYLSRHLHLNLKKALERAFGTVPFDQGLGADEVDMLVKEAVMKAFFKTDEDFLGKGNLDAGSTATTVLIMGKRIYSCNVGDSRTIISRHHALSLTSNDHKPSREDEARRIREAGGFIFQNRVMGELAVSRAFGDRELKKCMQDIMAPEELRQMALRDAKNNSGGGGGDGEAEVVKDYSQPLVIARPEILVAELTEKDDFVLLACDGLFDVFSNPEVVRFVLDEMRSHHDAQRACENLSYTAIHQRIAHDNVSIILLVTNKWW